MIGWLIGGAVAFAAWRLLRGNSPKNRPEIKLAPLTDLDVRWSSPDFYIAPTGLWTIRPEALARIAVQLQERRAFLESKQTNYEHRYLTDLPPGSDTSTSAAAWIAGEAASGRTVLLICGDPPFELLSVPAADSGKWAFPGGRGVLAWPGVSW